MDLTGEQYGNWSVLRWAPRGPSGQTRWLCRCACGTERIVSGTNLRAGCSRSCGCSTAESLPKAHDLSGRVFGRLTAIARIPPYGNNKTLWECVCACGRKTRSAASNLKSGMSKSCGCISIEKKRARSREHPPKPKSEYAAWRGMRRRCLSSSSASYHRYGGRGITICDRWRDSFDNFIADMGMKPSPGHSLDRVNNDGNYEPGNCRWATMTEQLRNTSTNRYITLNGETMPLSAWVERTGLPGGCIANRLDRGWDVERALTTPSLTGRLSKSSRASQVAA